MVEADLSALASEERQSPAPDVQAQLRQLEIQMEKAHRQFNEAPVPSFILDAEGRIAEVNGLGQALLGRVAEDLLERPLSQFMPVDAQGELRDLLRQAFTSALKERGLTQVQHAGGEVYDVLVDVVAYAAEGRPDWCHLVATDLTALGVLHPPQPPAAQGGRDQAPTTQALDQELEHVVSTLLRQLRRPTDRALNFLGLLRRQLGVMPEAVARPLQRAEEAVQDIIALSVSVSRYMDIRRLQPRLRQVDLNVVFRDVLKGLQPLAADRQVEIRCDVLPVLRADSQALHIILDEYLANALKYSAHREQAQVRVIVRETEAEYVIGVQDNGAGFDMRYREQLFQLFQRLHPSSRYVGSGIGLAGVRRLAERFGARAWGEGQVDQGATFWLAWPKAPPQPAED
ncbi:sensor histidine kinase [Deinococcus petrolearius]|uniref:histidine kinase n=1 Tax=Deinococcus petrolearius TaxID=1751295 RepID=A0ABW1DNW8_9DEIO